MDDLSGWETARLLRQQHNAAELPIIIVSADLFENQQEHLDAAACQAFVGKPVMDSELIDALARTLGLAWITQDDALPATEPQAPTLSGAPPLPQELYQDLLQLARFGNAHGVREVIAAASQRYPQLRPTLQVLLQHAARFDFNAFVDALRAVGTSEEPVRDDS